MPRHCRAKSKNWGVLSRGPFFLFRIARKMTVTTVIGVGVSVSVSVSVRLRLTAGQVIPTRTTVEQPHADRCLQCNDVPVSRSAGAVEILIEERGWLSAAVRQLRHHFWTIADAFFSAIPPHTCRIMFSTRPPRHACHPHAPCDMPYATTF